MPGPSRDETLTESPGGASPLVRPEPALFVVLECDRPQAGGSRHSLRGVSDVTLGRGDDRTSARDGHRLALTIPGAWMSSTHARLVRSGTGFAVEDLGSRNGTRVNGRPVSRLVLQDGDLIELGHALLVYRAAVHGGPETPADEDSRRITPPAPGMGTLVPALAMELASIARIAASRVPVLLRGETGTGKEVVARAVHALSGRAGTFVAVNCGAIPQALVESQLFGHTKGAFSGAVKDEPGFVRAAAGGTLFLDEVGDLPASSQAALLRVLQEGEVVPVGTTRPVAVDLRVVGATHQPLEALVARGAFRTDLLARLDGYSLLLAPLRERQEDLGLLVGALLRDIAEAPADLRLTADFGRALLAYRWPLNVRELRHCLTRAVALARGGTVLEPQHLPPVVAAALSAAPPEPAPSPPTEDDRLRAQLDALLAQHAGNVAEVARAMGKARMQVHRWMKRFSLDARRYRGG
ncbi:MAG TPA: sigma 54-interacting transcriptional regulator [Polyangiaceae bacterium]